MIIARAPLRVTLGGGGTDLPSYYSQHGGLVVAAAIDKYVYITLHTNFAQDLIVKYSKVERVAEASLLEHPIIREAFALVGLDGKGMEVTSMADIPAGTGLGSSGSFTVALLKALHAWKREFRTQAQIAEEACEIEIVRLGEPVGKQDQFIAAFGGLTRFDIAHNGDVTPAPLQIEADKVADLQDNLLLFFTGYSRSASAILGNQVQSLTRNDPETVKNLHFVKACGNECAAALTQGDTQTLGKLMDHYWQHKKARGGMSNEEINRLYEVGMANGAFGGKLVGAGGGGLLMFVAEDRTRLRAAMRKEGAQEVRFAFDFEGCKLLTV